MLTVNRLCGSGFQSIITGAQEIALGESSVVLAGGAENMSIAPFAVRRRFPFVHRNRSFSKRVH